MQIHALFGIRKEGARPEFISAWDGKNGSPEDEKASSYLADEYGYEAVRVFQSQLGR